MTFDQLNLNTPLLNALTDMGYTQPTTIQQKCFPVMMSGRDVVGIAQTGTGKTLAYLLPCLRELKFSKEPAPRILILVPTRELVMQVVEEVKKLTTYMSVKVTGIYGGMNIKNQIIEINEGLDIVVATPGRLIELALDGSLKLKSIKKLIIDEVDEMLNLGFRHQLTSILDILPLKRQNLLFSATITDEVDDLIEAFFNAPERIEAAPAGSPLENITQIGYDVPNFYTKIKLLLHLLENEEDYKKVLVFAATKKLADDVFSEIEPFFYEKLGIIHSNKDQNYRFNSVKQFHNGTFRVLIATDIIARGLDIAEVSHVFNFDMPEVPENYIHRIGRTGRADKKGVAIAFITPNDAEIKDEIETMMNMAIPMLPLPEEVPISKILTDYELPKVQMKEIRIKLPKRDLSGPAFHEKSEKNQKVNVKITRDKQMKLKYKKPKTRGDKNQNKW
jgi:ATP-dependent RNA helicase RhlE